MLAFFKTSSCYNLSISIIGGPLYHGPHNNKVLFDVHVLNNSVKRSLFFTLHNAAYCPLLVQIPEPEGSNTLNWKSTPLIHIHAINNLIGIAVYSLL